MQSFTIAPAGLRSAWLIFLILIPIIGLLCLSLMGSRSARFEVSAEGVRLRGDVYGRLIPAAQLHDMANGLNGKQVHRAPEPPDWVLDLYNLSTR
jgi:hypothetical protein